MSRENVEIVREVVARFNRDGFMPEELFDPEIELSNIGESPLPGPYRGYAGLREWREGVFEVIEEGRFEIDDLIDLDEAGLVIHRMRLLGRARHTGLDFNIEWTTLQWLRQGRIYRSESYTSHDEALEAAGLSE
jgi:ketosteroid isomerase-like protein